MYFHSTKLFVAGFEVMFALGLSAVSIVAAAESAGATRDLHSAETVTGKVVFAGRHEKSKPMPVFKNRAFCGATVPDETLLVSADGGLANAVVIFHSLEKSPTLQPGGLTLDNKHCAFMPHVQVGVVGSELLLKNSDPILHTVHARLGNETLFNVGLPRWRQVTKRLERPGLIRITCDVLHTWMSAAIVVVDSPFFAVTDRTGAFRLDHLPPGNYQMSVWHERLGTRREWVSVAPNASAHIEVIYGEEKSK
jgi:hypothetical protein